MLQESSDDRLTDVFGSRSTSSGAERVTPIQPVDFESAYEVEVDTGRRMYFLNGDQPTSHLRWVADLGTVPYSSTLADWGRDAPRQLQALAVALRAQKRGLDPEYGAELCALSVTSGEFVSFAAADGEYVRVVSADGTELVYWNSDEFAEDPAGVCGALAGALRQGA